MCYLMALIVAATIYTLWRLLEEADAGRSTHSERDNLLLYRSRAAREAERKSALLGW